MSSRGNSRGGGRGRGGRGGNHNNNFTSVALDYDNLTSSSLGKFSFLLFFSAISRS